MTTATGGLVHTMPASVRLYINIFRVKQMVLGRKREGYMLLSEIKTCTSCQVEWTLQRERERKNEKFLRNHQCWCTFVHCLFNADRKRCNHECSASCKMTCFSRAHLIYIQIFLHTIFFKHYWQEKNKGEESSSSSAAAGNTRERRISSIILRSVDVSSYW